MIEHGSSVVLCAHSQYRGVFVGIVSRLKVNYQAQIHLYVATKQEAVYYQKTHPDLFDTISVANALYASCAEPVADAAAVIKTARKNEAELGIGINALAVSDRHLGRGFSLGGFNHPRSRISEETDYAQMLNGFNSVIGYWRQVLEEKSPALILHGPKELCILARKRGIPVRVLAGSRYKNYYYWAENEFLETPAIEAAFATARPTEHYELTKPYESHLQYRAHFRREATLWRTIKSIAEMVLRHAYWHVRRYEKAKGYYLRENIRHSWRWRKDIRKMTRNALPGLSEFTRRPFAFFPLATEPETALQTLSPEYLCQLAAITSVARDLPADAELAVKEHYAAAGRRPADFHAQIMDLKNARLMNMAELGLEAVRASKAVVTISGTSGFEGAAMGKPVISFGRHNIYNFLPHVMVVTDEVQLKGYLEAAFGDAFDREQAVIDGRRFLQAMVDASFDLMDFQPIRPEEISADAIDASYSALLDTLQRNERPLVEAAYG